jgi:hypothetical protein
MVPAKKLFTEIVFTRVSASIRNYSGVILEWE